MNRENKIDGRGKKQCRINPGDAAAEETVVSEIRPLHHPKYKESAQKKEDVDSIMRPEKKVIYGCLKIRDRIEA